jgi:hypothetical protein
MRKSFLILIILAMMIGGASALTLTPTTVSLISGGNATFTCGGATTTCWFLWGANTATPEWDTPNQTTTGTCTATVKGGTYYPQTKYVVKCCDITGCGAQTAFTSTTNAPIPQTTYGAILSNITDNGFDLGIIATDIVQPYFWAFGESTVTPYLMSIFIGLILFGYFVSLWMRQRSVSGPVFVGIILLTMMSTLGWVIPPEFQQYAMIIAYMALAGALLSLIKKG